MISCKIILSKITSLS